MQTLDKLIPLPKAAEILGISLSTAYRWSSKRRLEVVKVGGRVLVHPAALSDFISQNTRRAARV